MTDEEKFRFDLSGFLNRFPSGDSEQGRSRLRLLTNLIESNITPT